MDEGKTKLFMTKLANSISKHSKPSIVPYLCFRSYPIIRTYRYVALNFEGCSKIFVSMTTNIKTVKCKFFFLAVN